MTARAWIYQRLMAIPEVKAKTGNRIAQVSFWTNVPKVKPYITIRMLPSLTAMSGDDGVVIWRHPTTIMVHDTPGNYDQIDELLQLIHTDLQNAIDPGNNPAITNCKWVSHSEDFRDDPMGVILKWSQYNIFAKGSL